MEEPISDVEETLENQQGASGETGGDDRAISETPIPESRALTLYDQMAQQWKMPLSDRQALVNPPPGGTVTVPMVERVTIASRMYGIPIPGFNLIPIPKTGGHTLYINANGIQFRLATDPRGLKSITPVIEHMPDLDKEKDYISVKARIDMKDGSFSEDWGISEWPVLGGRNMGMGLGDLIMKLTTKAIRRASIRLVGASLPIFDDDWHRWVSGRGKDIVDGNFTVEPPPPKESPDNLGELLAFAKERYELDMKDVLELMGMVDVNELDDIDKAWERIKESGTPRDMGGTVSS